MAKVNHRIVQMEATDGTQVAVQIPVGSFDKPTKEADVIFAQITDQENWKEATEAYVTDDVNLANDVAYALDWYTGGHEMAPTRDGRIVVWSKGYYAYTMH